VNFLTIRKFVIVKRIRPVGIYEFSHSFGQVWPELGRGTVFRLVNLTGGRHRAWIAAEPPDGCDPERTGPGELIRHLGARMEDVREGTVLEIWGGEARGALGYMFWSATPEIIAAGEAQELEARSRYGLVRRRMDTLGVEAEPVPSRRRAVPAHA
jgi:hypothetical protein